MFLFSGWWLCWFIGYCVALLVVWGLGVVWRLVDFVGLPFGFVSTCLRLALSLAWMVE